MRLLADVEAGQVDCVVCYKLDRLSRSLLDFARIIGILEKHHVAFVSITQQFNSATSWLPWKTAATCCSSNQPRWKFMAKRPAGFGIRRYLILSPITYTSWRNIPCVPTVTLRN